MPRKLFKEYTGSNIQPLAPGYLETLSNAYSQIGQGIAALGKGIGAGISGAYTANQEAAAAAAPANAAIDMNKQEIDRFVSSGDIVMQDGVAKPAPGREGMFNSSSLKRSLDMYNKTGGKDSSQVDDATRRSAYSMYEIGQKQDAAAREERILQLKEAEAQRAKSEGDRKFDLQAYVELGKSRDALVKADLDDKKAAALGETQYVPNPERQRQIDVINRALDGLSNSFAPKPQSVANIPSSPQPATEPAKEPEKPSESKAADVKPIPAPSKAPATGDTASANIEDPAVRAAIENPVGISGAVTPVAVASQANPATRIGDSNNFVVRTTGGDGVKIVRNPGSPGVSWEVPEGTMVDYAPIYQDTVIANELITKGKVADFQPTPEQLDFVRQQGYPVHPDHGASWTKGLVASLVMQGKVNAAPGQNREWLGQGMQASYRLPAGAGGQAGPVSMPNYSTEQNLSVNTAPRFPSLVTELPSKRIVDRFMRNGLEIDAQTAAALNFRDQNARFTNDIAMDMFKAEQLAWQARESRAKATQAFAETAKIWAGIGSTIGESSRGYPGVFEPSGQTFGGFTRSLPYSSVSGKPLTVGQIQEVLNGVYNDKNPESASQLASIQADLSRGRMSEEQMKLAAKSRSDFVSGTSALESIAVELKRQGVKADSLTGFIGLKLEQLGLSTDAATVRAESIHSLFMMGSLRESIAGPGNPAIYEQLLIRAAIPQTNDFFSIPKWEAAKARTLALAMAGSYMEGMARNGMSPTPDSVSDINARLKPIFGEKFVPFSNDELIGPNGWINVRSSEAKANAWLRARGMMTEAELRAARGR